MSSINYQSSRRKSPPNLVIAAARCGVRRALRPFIRREGTPFVAILVVAEGMADYYRRAADAIIQEPMPVDEDYNELAAVIAIKEPTDGQAVFSRLRHARQMVMVTEKLDHISPALRAAADVVVEVALPSPEHFLAAARYAAVPGMTMEIARFISGFSLDVLLMNVRSGRPLLSTIRQLKRISINEEPVPARNLAGPVLEEMAGYGAAKDWGLQLAEDLRAWKAGEIAWEEVDRGALLYGPPGCGKTSYARALANSCGVGLVLASAARWQAAGHLGDYLKAMRASFAEARKQSPSILFIDEFDSFGDRESGGDQDHLDYKRQVINGLLELLDPAEGREGIVVVGATNNPSAIDRALLRSGRLETRIEIPLPDGLARVAILRHHLRDQMPSDNLSGFVSVTAGWSGADIEKVARDARRLARLRKTTLSVDLLMEAMPARYVLSIEELRHAAVHEAGHAIVSVVLNFGVLSHVRIAREAVPGMAIQSLGTTAIEREVGRIRTSGYYDDQIAMFMGGIAAETVVYGNHGDGAGGDPTSDLWMASDLATRAERHYGFGGTLSVELGKGNRPLEYLRERDPELRRLVDARLRTQFERAVVLLKERRAELDQLSQTLVTAGSVGGDYVRRLCGAKSEDIDPNP